MIVTPKWATRASTFDRRDAITRYLIDRGMQPGPAYRKARLMAIFLDGFEVSMHASIARFAAAITETVEVLKRIKLR